MYAGENLYVKWSPDGNVLAVSDKNDVISFIDTSTRKVSSKKQFPYEVNDISWDNSGSLFCVTNGKGQIPIFLLVLKLMNVVVIKLEGITR